MSGLPPSPLGGHVRPRRIVVGLFSRGVVVDLSVLALFRVVLRRQGGGISLPDVVLPSEAASLGLSVEAKSVPNGLATVLALLVCNDAVDWLSVRSKWVQRLLEPLVLMVGGRVNRDHLKREHISDDESDAQLRENGVEA